MYTVNEIGVYSNPEYTVYSIAHAIGHLSVCAAMQCIIACLHSRNISWIYPSTRKFNTATCTLGISLFRISGVAKLRYIWLSTVNCTSRGPTRSKRYVFHHTHALLPTRASKPRGCLLYGVTAGRYSVNYIGTPLWVGPTLPWQADILSELVIAFKHTIHSRTGSSRIRLSKT